MKVRVVGRSVTALAMGLALTVGSASLASASGHRHESKAKGHDYASGKASSFDYANVGRGGYVTAVTTTSVTVQRRDGSTTYTLAPTTTYATGSTAATFSSLVVGDRIRVQLSKTTPQTVTSVTIEPAELEGQVTAISGTSITIVSDGVTRTIVTSPTTTYREDGASATFASVIVGARVSAEGSIDANGTSLDANSINIQVPPVHQENARGVVSALTSSSLTLLSRDGTSTAFTLTPTTTYKEGKTTIAASALAVGQSVDVEFSSAAPTTALSVEVKLSSASGKVTAISGNTITLAGHEGNSKTIIVSSTTTFTNEDGTSATLTSVTVGTTIHAEGTLSPDQTTLNALSISIDNDATPNGETSVDGNAGSGQSDQGNSANQSADLSISSGVTKD